MNSKKVLTLFAATALIVVIIFSSTVIAAPAVQSYLNVLIQNKAGMNQDVPVIINDDDPIDVDVSGWLHTTSSGKSVFEVPDGTYNKHFSQFINTEGYRKVTITVKSDTLDTQFSVLYYNQDTVSTNNYSYWDYEVNGKDSNGNKQITVVLDVISEGIEIEIMGWDGAVITLVWYLTT